VVEDGIAGQLLLHLVIDPRAALLGGGDGDLPEWDGDRYVLWEEDDEWCVRIAVAGDIEGFVEAFESSVFLLDADVEEEDGLAVLTSCR
jgi:hypothetical protein